MKELMKKLKEEYILIKNTNLFKIMLIILSLLLPLFFEKFIYNEDPFSIIRYIINSLIFIFASCNLIFDMKKMWNFIYKYRYLIGISIFVVLVLGEFHGSSINIMNDIIEPGYSINSSKNIIGESRRIRSDEWNISSPTILSQLTENNNLSPINKTMMGGINTRVELFPKLPTRTIAIILSPKMLGFLFLPKEKAFSFYWYLEYFILFFASFEFFMILTKKNKFFSLVGAAMITFAPAVQWWEATNIVGYGMLAIVFFDRFLNSKKISKKIFYSTLVGYCGALYISSMYPAWIIPYGYFFLIIVIWQLMENKEKYNLKDFLILLPIALLVIGSLLIPVFLSSIDIYKLESSTAYPGARFSTGGSNLQNLFYHTISLFLPYINMTNASEASQYLGLYPLPLILGIYYYIKNRKEKKKDILLVLLIIYIVLLGLWNYVKLPTFIAKISLLYMSLPERTANAVCFASNVLLIVILANYYRKEEHKKDEKIVAIVLGTILTVISTIVAQLETEYTGKTIFIFSLLVFSTLYYLIILNRKNNKKLIGISLIILSLVSGLFVHPLSRGLDAIYEKPIAKEVRKIVSKEPNSIWITEYLQSANYFLANGTKIINSTNYYPNIKLWKVMDKDKKYEKTWNRYSNLSINILDGKTNIKLIDHDQVALNLDNDDICKLKVDYLISPSPIRDELSDEFIEIKKIYTKDSLFIYKINCNN